MNHPKLEVYFRPYPLEIFSKGGVVHGWIPKIRHGSHVPRGNPQDMTLSNFLWTPDLHGISSVVDGVFEG